MSHCEKGRLIEYIATGKHTLIVTYSFYIYACVYLAAIVDTL